MPICGGGWLLLGPAARQRLGRGGLRAMLMIVGVGGVLIFINFLALRQAVTPAPLLGRMTETMRWLILLAAAPGRVAGRLARRARRLRRRTLFAAGVSGCWWWCLAAAAIRELKRCRGRERRRLARCRGRVRPAE